MCESEALDETAVQHFKEYLRVRSVQPEVDYTDCVQFLRRMAEGLAPGGLPLHVHEVAPGKPVVVLTWTGLRPELPSLLLSSHMDVVPVFPDQWTHDPFSADEDEQGNIYARGAQDMKCVGVQYLEAVRRLVLERFQPRRTVHICYTPDEEIGSHGMRMFVQTDAFRTLNVGCALDEGAASPDDSFVLDYGERTPYNVLISCEATPSTNCDVESGEKLSIVLKRFLEKRSEEKHKLKYNPELTVGDITSINLTILKGCALPNDFSPEFQIMFDCRVSLNTDLEEFESWVTQVCTEAGDGVRVEYINKKKRIEPTVLSEENIWWLTLKRQFAEMKMEVTPRVCPASTDSRYIRGLGIPAFNFSPMNHTELKLHDHNEYLNRKVFLRGIIIYRNIISALTSI